MTPKSKKMDFESALQRLEEITDLLESGDKSLEESIKFYSEGLELSKFCDEKLSATEEKIRIITEKKGLPVEEDFDEDEE
ncbi:MAG: exodeoxyribonuclease VII small subunit [candidate division Zixibacteria bacterium]|nr:exodeoxyribonuclease VII small subunit [candidate division Zixibacteria bacterium]